MAYIFNIISSQVTFSYTLLSFLLPQDLSHIEVIGVPDKARSTKEERTKSALSLLEELNQDAEEEIPTEQLWVIHTPPERLWIFHTLQGICHVWNFLSRCNVHDLLIDYL